MSVLGGVLHESREIWAYFFALNQSCEARHGSAFFARLIFGEPFVSYRMEIQEKDVYGKSRYANTKGNTECVEFVRQVTGAPKTIAWGKGKKISDAKFGEIIRGTAIATFDKNGRYPTDSLGRHAAIYLEHNDSYITVLDQWNGQGEVKQRSIWFNQPNGTKRSNDADTFYVIE